MRSRHLRRSLGAVAATAVVAAGGVLTTTSAYASNSVDINVVTINDFHGRIENDGASGGIAALTTAVKQARAANPNTIFAGDGDLVGASTFTSFIQNDEPTIDGLNAAGLEVSSVGNHEFDQGWHDLRDRIAPRAKWQYLAANLHDKATGKPIMPEYWVKDVDGVKVGFIGAVTNELPNLVSPSGLSDVVVGDATENVNRVANALTDGDSSNGEADVLILLVHEGAASSALADSTDPNSAFGRIVNGVTPKVNAIVSAHTHQTYNHVIANRPVISSGQYGEKFSNLSINFDRSAHKLNSIENKTFSMKTNGALNYPEDATVLRDIVEPAKKVAQEKGAVSVGEITADFNRAQQPGSPNPIENRGGESTLGNWAADVHLWAAQQDRPDTAIAFMNPGGLRADMKYASAGSGDPDGNVTYREAAAVQPFANTLVTKTLTGAQIRKALEQQWQPAGSSRPFLKLGVSKDLSYIFDPEAPVGSRISQVLLKGEPLKTDGTYSVVMNSFLASGGDNFTVFAEGTNAADTGRVDLQSVVAWFQTHKTAAPDTAQRAVGVHLSQPANATGFAPGEEIKLNLSGLDFTTSEKKAEEVTVTIDGGEAHSSIVDATPTSGNDLTGTAIVQTRVPASASGTASVRVTTKAGTDISFPIQVVKAPFVQPEVAVSSRCAAGRTMLTSTVKNVSATAIDVTVVSSHGKKTFSSLAPGATGATTFLVRGGVLTPGDVQFQVQADGVSHTQTVGYTARTCGK